MNTELTKQHLNQTIALHEAIDKFGIMFNDYLIQDKQTEIELETYIKSIQALNVGRRETFLMFCLRIVLADLESLIGDQTLKLNI